MKFPLILVGNPVIFHDEGFKGVISAYYLNYSPLDIRLTLWNDDRFRKALNIFQTVTSRRFPPKLWYSQNFCLKQEILMRKIQFYKIIFLICFWLFCAIFITFHDSAVLGFKSEIVGGHYSFLRNLIAVIITCAIGATLLGSLEVLYLSKLLRKKPFWYYVID